MHTTTRVCIVIIIIIYWLVLHITKSVSILLEYAYELVYA